MNESTRDADQTIDERHATRLQDEDAGLHDEDAPALLARMEVRGLFGRYSYDIEVPAEAGSERLLLFYADNGRGKTTVLRLLWHLLSPANNRGHRTAIGQIPFERVYVTLSDGTEIRASRASANDGPYVLRLRREGKTISETEWAGANERNNRFTNWSIVDLRTELEMMPEDLQREARDQIARSAYVNYLLDLQVRPYFLADDRNIYSDELEETLRSRRQAIGQAREYQILTESRVTAFNPENAQGSVAQELETSLRRANEMLGQMTLGATASGSASANSVYLDVLRRLAGTPSSSAGRSDAALPLLVSMLRRLGERSRDFERLGLVPNFGSADFIEVLNSLPDDRVSIAEEVLGPFVASHAARLDALQDAQSLIRTFLDQTNGFLIDKELTFEPRRGLRIQLEDGEVLAPPQLSSGERQLILLLCNALLSRRGTRLFLIDEPELSLNAKWQRNIVPALLACTDGSSVQFIIATHSLELLSSYRSNVVRLKELVP